VKETILIRNVTDSNRLHNAVVFTGAIVRLSGGIVLKVGYIELKIDHEYLTPPSKTGCFNGLPYKKNIALRDFKTIVKS